jgi:hypothetical protein
MKVFSRPHRWVSTLPHKNVLIEIPKYLSHSKWRKYTVLWVCSWEFLTEVSFVSRISCHSGKRKCVLRLRWKQIFQNAHLDWTQSPFQHDFLSLFKHCWQVDYGTIPDSIETAFTNRLRDHHKVD